MYNFEPYNVLLAKYTCAAYECSRDIRCKMTSPGHKHLHKSNQIKSNQITFIVTSPQHKCLGEWNSYERAPDSAEKQQTIYIWTDSAKKNNNSNLHMDRQCKKKQQQQFTYGQTVQKKTTTAIYIWTDSAKKNNNSNLHMDRQCKKKQQQQFTYGQTVQKKQQQFTYGQYIFTDCTEDNVQNTHTCTQYA